MSWLSMMWLPEFIFIVFSRLWFMVRSYKPLVEDTMRTFLKRLTILSNHANVFSVFSIIFSGITIFNFYVSWKYREPFYIGHAGLLLHKKIYCISIWHGNFRNKSVPNVWNVTLYSLFVCFQSFEFMFWMIQIVLIQNIW